MKENFSHEQSLSLINEMINRARNNIREKGATPLIYWGYLTAALAIINSVLLCTLNNPQQSFFIWLAMLPAGLVLYFRERRIKRETLIKTHIDKIGAMVWMGFLIAFAVFLVVINTIGFKFGFNRIFMLNMPVMMILLGMGHFISACVYRNKIWYAIAALMWTGAIVCVFVDVNVQLIVLAACMVFGFAVPGHILNYQAKKSHV